MLLCPLHHPASCSHTYTPTYLHAHMPTCPHVHGYMPTCPKAAKSKKSGPPRHCSIPPLPKSAWPGVEFLDNEQNPRNAPKCVKSAQRFFLGPSGGKSDAADPFSIVPRGSFEICAKCAKSAQRFFFGPSGGKSDAADPF